MPVVAIAVAIGSWAVAGSAVAATVGGLAAISLTTAFTIVAAVGATVGAIGVVSRDKTLTMVGGAIGLVGAVGGLASAAGLFGAEAAAGASLFGPSAAESTASAASNAASSAGGSAAGALIDGPGMSLGAGMSAAEAASSGTINWIDAGMGLAKGLGGAPGGAPGQPVSAENASTTNTASVVRPDVVPAGQGGDSGELGAIGGVSKQIGAPTPILTVGNAGNATPSPDTSVFDRIMNFADKNPTLTAGAITVGGNFLQGAFSSLTPAQVAAYNAQAAANDATAAMLNQQKTNLAMPRAVARSAPVTGAPEPIIQNMGLINRPMITGAPA